MVTTAARRRAAVALWLAGLLVLPALVVLPAPAAALTSVLAAVAATLPLVAGTAGRSGSAGG